MQFLGGKAEKMRDTLARIDRWLWEFLPKFGDF